MPSCGGARLGFDDREARARLGRLDMIRGEKAGGEVRWAMRAKYIPGAGRPRLIVVEPKAIEAGGEADQP